MYLDIKNVIGADLYKTPEQQADKTYGNIYAHSNGVMFEGKIVNFEWLGHYAFGARKGLDYDALEPFYDWMADGQQLLTSGQTKGQGETDSDFHKAAQEKGRRRYNGEQKNEADLAPYKNGSFDPFFFSKMTYEEKFAYFRADFIAKPVVTVYKDRQTRTETEAYRLAAEWVKETLGNASYVKCWGVCGSSGDDTVTCSWATETDEGGTTDFIFDDICDGTPNYTTLHVERKFSSVQTRTEHEARMKTEDYIRAEYPGSTDLICDADCSLIGDDTVYCFFKKGGTQYKQEFVFEDICN